MEKVDCKITKEVHIVSFDISGIRIELFNKAIISVVFHCEDGENIYKEITLCDKSYLEWGNDDNYIVNFITENAHLILDGLIYQR